MWMEMLGQLGLGTLCLLVGALGLAFAFEAVNGFHDTANAVATVIYTRSLRPTTAVVWSGLCNMAGILLGGIGVAFSIVHLLPVDLLVNVHTGAGLAMILSLLLSALLWNLGTWFLGLPASSSHALIGSILGVGIANALFVGHDLATGVNFHKLTEVGLSLLISPLLGFGLSALLLAFLNGSRAQEVLARVPSDGDRPPFWVRGILFLTCSGVSFAHGSNDGQKGMGLVMLILIGLVPAQYALNLESKGQARIAMESASQLKSLLDQAVAHRKDPGSSRHEIALGMLGTSAYAGPETGTSSGAVPVPAAYATVTGFLGGLTAKLGGKESFREVPPGERWQLRQDLIHLDQALRGIESDPGLSASEVASLRGLRRTLRESTEYVPTWVIVAIALALGLGTMVGWKRIVVTVGEKIGKSHLTYGQGAAAELIAMSTIGLGNAAGLPVSTTHVLSSGVAGTMWANRSGINGSTARSILLAWILTLPATVLLAGALFLFARLVLGS